MHASLSPPVQTSPELAVDTAQSSSIASPKEGRKEGRLEHSDKHCWGSVTGVGGRGGRGVMNKGCGSGGYVLGWKSWLKQPSSEFPQLRGSYSAVDRFFM